jgi:hypothetical protein
MDSPTTILTGAPGVPTVVIRDHDGWQAQVAAENRARVDEQVRATVAAAERGETERRYAPPAFPGGRDEMIAAARANMALAAERREAPRRIAAELDVTEALIGAMAAAEPPPPDPVRQRWDRANRYSSDLAVWMARHRERVR